MSKPICTLLSSLVIASALGCSSTETQKSSSASAQAPIGSLESAIVTDAGVDAGNVDAGAEAAP